jgi:phenylalanyl-tRNA synthetase alpha chain
MTVLEDLAALKTEALGAIERAGDTAALDDVRVAFLGKKGSLTAVLRAVGSLSTEERPAVGKESNLVRAAIEEALEARKRALASSEMADRLQAEALDVTMPSRRRAPGHRHLISQITSQIVDIFIGLGYQVAEGPEAELDYYNFTALNHPPDHPARGLQDTLYVKDLSGDEAAVTGESDVMLRTHTSPVQVRIMEGQRPPLYVISPGRVYRPDAADPSHLPQFTRISP